MRKKICVIDIGTNSVVYLLCLVDNSRHIRTLDFKVKTTRLGYSIRTRHTLRPDAQARTIITVRQFLANASKNMASHFIIAGTSALRDAKNNSAFAKKLYKETNKRIIILSEKQEAELVFSAVQSAFFSSVSSAKLVVADIGGGSTELSISKDGKLIKVLSIPVGAVNLYERFKNNIGNMEKFAKSKIYSYTGRNNTGFRLITAGGTVTTAVSVIKRLRKYDPKRIHRSVILYPEIIKLINKLQNLTLNGRKAIIGIEPQRADIIIAGLIILKIIMEIFKVERLTVSSRGLVYGLALDRNVTKHYGIY